MTTFAPTVEGFFAERLIAQRQVSGRTVIAYRDTVRMLLAWAEQQTGKSPSQLDVADVSYELVSSFLTHLEAGCSPKR